MKPEQPNHLKALREAHNYTQEFVGNYLKMTRQAYGHYESGRRTPSPDTLLKLAKLYGLSMDALMKDSPPCDFENINSAKTIPRYENITKREQELLNLFSQISTLDQDEIIGIIRLKIQLKKRERKSKNQPNSL